MQVSKVIFLYFLVALSVVSAQAGLDGVDKPDTVSSESKTDTNQTPMVKSEKSNLNGTNVEEKSTSQEKKDGPGSRIGKFREPVKDQTSNTMWSMGQDILQSGVKSLSSGTSNLLHGAQSMGSAAIGAVGKTAGDLVTGAQKMGTAAASVVGKTVSDVASGAQKLGKSASDTVVDKWSKLQSNLNTKKTNEEAYLMLKGKASQSLPSESSGTLSPKEIDRNPGVKHPSLVNFE